MKLSHIKLPVSFIILIGFFISCGGSGGPGPINSGLDSRPANTVCVAFNPAGGYSAIPAPIFSNLSFDQPVALVQHPTDDQRWYVLEKPGRVLTFLEGDTTATTFIDLTAQVDDFFEGGLLGMAFHPQFSTNGEVFLSYTITGNPLISVVSRVISSDNGLTAPINSETELLAVDQPYGNHNGGWIGFDSSGLFYIGLGDGGSGGDPEGNGQDTTTLLGAMLRIDVDTPDALRNKPYSIPAGNPFSANLDCTAGCPEIFAWGLRNPWRCSFDFATGNFWVGDVGQQSREEIDLVIAGANYGWNILEGNDCYPPGSSCNSTGLTPPVFDYGRTEGTSITGGYVYTGSELPSLFGSYVYGDFGNGNIWRLDPDGIGGYESSLLVNSGLNITSFGQGRDGEIFIVSIGDGLIYALQQDISASIPSRLSEINYVLDTDRTQPAACFIPYEINASFWSDGADKRRFFAIPDGTSVDISNAANWQLPPGSVTLKSFWIDNQPVEMRVLLRFLNGQWAGYTYEWDDNSSDFVRVVGGKTTTVAGQTWIFPSESDCLRCHPAAAGRTLGLETAQLNKDFTYPTTGRTANQLTTYDAIGLLSPRLPASAGQLAALPDPLIGRALLQDRAKAYLHTNCAQCHRPSGPTPSNMDLRYDTPLAQMQVCEATVQGVTLGITDPRIIAPGDPDGSILLQRTKLRDENGMPPLASSVADTQGADLLEQWIVELLNCP